jgi:hypothetical protein
MPYNASLKASRQLILLPTTTLTTADAAGLGTAATELTGMVSLSVQAVFVYGSGGTSATFYVQTSLDAGTTWFDIMCFAFTTSSATAIHSVRAQTAVTANYTPTAKALTANTIKDGLLGCCVRLAYSTVGTYAGGTTITITGVSKGA